MPATGSQRVACDRCCFGAGGAKACMGGSRAAGRAHEIDGKFTLE
jgi:hypothetical protein